MKCRIGDLPDGIQMSLSSWRAWIEIEGSMVMTVAASRSPHGERGLKYTILVKGGVVEQSLSSWRAWIEICDSLRRAHVWKSLSSWRAWIEMKTGRMPPTPATCRSPHGERGLKYDSHGAAQDHRRSLSSWRAWIEIRPRPCRCRQLRSLSSWRAWIEIRRTIPSSNRPTSRSPHGERGLKYAGQPDPRPHPRRSPHGERGLK